MKPQNKKFQFGEHRFIFSSAEFHESNPEAQAKPETIEKTDEQVLDENIQSLKNSLQTVNDLKSSLKNLTNIEDENKLDWASKKRITSIKNFVDGKDLNETINKTLELLEDPSQQTPENISDKVSKISEQLGYANELRNSLIEIRKNRGEKTPELAKKEEPTKVAETEINRNPENFHMIGQEDPGKIEEKKEETQKNDLNVTLASIKKDIPEEKEAEKTKPIKEIISSVSKNFEKGITDYNREKELTEDTNNDDNVRAAEVIINNLTNTDTTQKDSLPTENEVQNSSMNQSQILEGFINLSNKFPNQKDRLAKYITPLQEKQNINEKTLKQYQDKLASHTNRLIGEINNDKPATETQAVAQNTPENPTVVVKPSEKPTTPPIEPVAAPKDKPTDTTVAKISHKTRHKGTKVKPKEVASDKLLTGQLELKKQASLEFIQNNIKSIIKENFISKGQNEQTSEANLRRLDNAIGSLSEQILEKYRDYVNNLSTEESVLKAEKIDKFIKSNFGSEIDMIKSYAS